MRGLQSAGLLDGPARDALQAALDRVAALQQAHRNEKEASLPTKVLHDRACRDRDQAVQKLSRTQGELEETQAQLESLLKRQESLQARVKEQSAKVEAAAKRVQELGQRLAVETAGTIGASPFAAGGPGFPAPATSPFKRQRAEGEADDADMGRRVPPGSPTAAELAALQQQQQQLQQQQQHGGLQSSSSNSTAAASALAAFSGIAG
jgi:hypothetical protein